MDPWPIVIALILIALALLPAMLSSEISQADEAAGNDQASTLDEEDPNAGR